MPPFALARQLMRYAGVRLVSTLGCALLYWVRDFLPEVASLATLARFLIFRVLLGPTNAKRYAPQDRAALQ